MFVHCSTESLWHCSWSTVLLSTALCATPIHTLHCTPNACCHIPSLGCPTYRRLKSFFEPGSFSVSSSRGFWMAEAHGIVTSPLFPHIPTLIIICHAPFLVHASPPWTDHQQAQQVLRLKEVFMGSRPSSCIDACWLQKAPELKSAAFDCPLFATVSRGIVSKTS